MQCNFKFEEFNLHPTKTILIRFILLLNFSLFLIHLSIVIFFNEHSFNVKVYRFFLVIKPRIETRGKILFIFQTVLRIHKIVRFACSDLINNLDHPHLLMKIISLISR